MIFVNAICWNPYQVYVQENVTELVNSITAIAKVSYIMTNSEFTTGLLISDANFHSQPLPRANSHPLNEANKKMRMLQKHEEKNARRCCYDQLW